MQNDSLTTKLLQRPIDSDTIIKSAKIETKEEYLFLFEESFWEGTYIYSIILLKEQFSENFTRERVEKIIKRYFPQHISKQATYSANGEYLFYNYRFRVE